MTISELSDSNFTANTVHGKTGASGYIYDESPSVPHPPQFNTSVPHKRATPFQPPKSLSSTLKTPQFNKPPSVQHQKPLSFTPKPPQFLTETPSVPHQKPLSSTHPPLFAYIERFLGLKRSGPSVWN